MNGNFNVLLRLNAVKGAEYRIWHAIKTDIAFQIKIELPNNLLTLLHSDTISPMESSEGCRVGGWRCDGEVCPPLLVVQPQVSLPRLVRREVRVESVECPAKNPANSLTIFQPFNPLTSCGIFRV